VRLLDGVDVLESRALLATTGASVLQSIAITPADPSIPIGEVQPYSAIGTYSDNSTKDLSSQVTWASTNTSVATISNAAISPGVAAGLATGTTTITASLDGLSATADLKVTPVILEMIMLSPTTTSVAPGGTVQYMAMGMYSDNSMADFTDQVTWSSSNTSAATISGAPVSPGLATGVGGGTSIISASFDGVTGTARLSVTASTPPPLVSLTNFQFAQNRAHKVTQITLDFSGAVDASQADNVSTYHLAPAGKNGSSNGKNATVFKLKSAVYDATSNEVILTPRVPFALSRPVQVIVSGLQDTLGRMLNGNGDGQASCSAEALLRRKG
jgi:hypothetical protein